MNVVEKANEVSVFGRWAAGVSQVTSPWEYSIRRNVPAFTTIQTEDSSKVWSNGSTLSWTLPRLGLLRDCKFRISISPAIGDVAGTQAIPKIPLLNTAGGTAMEYKDAEVVATKQARVQSIMIPPGGLFKLFSQYELKARTREIARMYPENCYYYYMSDVFRADKNTGSQDQTPAISTEVSRSSRISPLDAINLFKLYSLFPRTGSGADNVTKTASFYIHAPFSYFQRMGNALLTSFAEDMSLNLLCNSSLFDALGSMAQYVAAGQITVTPCYTWIQPRPEEMAKLRQQMLASNLGIPRLQFSCLSEGDGVQPTTLGGATAQELTIKLNCSYPVIRTLFWIENNVGLTGLNSPHAPDTLTCPISKVEVSGSGTTFLSMDESALLEQMVHPPYNKIMSGRILYCINWSLLDNNTEMGGYLPTRNLSNLTMKVTAYLPDDEAYHDKGQAADGPTASTLRTAATHRLRVIHEYYVIEQTVPSNGQVNVSAFD
jgi:hypothetical protein